MILVLRDHRPLAPPPLRKQGSPRGASRSRAVLRQPVARAQWPTLSWSSLTALFWPLLLVTLALALWWFQGIIRPYIDPPISRVRVEGDLAYLGQDSVQKSIAPYAQHTFFDANVTTLRQQLEQVPWIASVEVQKIWPDRLVIRLTEQLPVARWGDNALLSSQGRSFTPDDVGRYSQLPRLWGPPQAQQKVMQHYQIFSQLLRPLHINIASLEMHDQGSWHLITDRGVELVLGRERVLDKLRRFLTVYASTLKNQTDNIARVDLRYPNGFAVAWRVPPSTLGKSSSSPQ